MKKTTKIVAEVCLYGTRETGAGYILNLGNGTMIGDGRPVAHRSFTEAVWMAVDIAATRGIRAGRMTIYHPGGETMSIVNLAEHVPSYGMLDMIPAPGFTINAEALMAAAQ